MSGLIVVRRFDRVPSAVLRLPCAYIAMLSMLLLLSSCGLFGDRYSVNSAGQRVETLGARLDRLNQQRATIPGVDVQGIDVQSIDVQTANGQRQQDALKTASPRNNEFSAGRHTAAGLTGLEVAKAYRRAYDLIDDPVAKNRILQRLAAIDLKSAENLEAAGLLPQSHEAYAVAIEAYLQLLTGETNQDRDGLLYGLAKAYAMTGQADAAFSSLTQLIDAFPRSDYWFEAQFRRGEHLFVNADFAEAEQVFAALLARGASITAVQPASLANAAADSAAVDNATADNVTADSPVVDGATANREPKAVSSEMLVNARYMLAWSQFKRADYSASINSFITLLDQKTATDSTLGDHEPWFVALAGAENWLVGESAFIQADKLVDDALRAIALALAYAPVESSTADLTQLFTGKPYNHWVYAKLAELFFMQERFADSAAIYAHYEQNEPSSALAPWFSRQAIGVLQHAEFNERAWQRKALFADRYHPLAAYYREHQQRPWLINYLDQPVAQYIDELASYHHARARLAAVGPRGDVTSNGNGDDYQQAAYWYRQKISAYPDHPEIGNSYYLLGESLQESAQLVDAIAAWEVAAYGGVGFKPGTESEAVEAGYAAILAYSSQAKILLQSQTNSDALVEGIVEESVEESVERILEDSAEGISPYQRWQGKKIESALLFAERFPGDERRGPVLATSIDDLQQLQDWPKLIEVADILLQSSSLQTSSPEKTSDTPVDAAPLPVAVDLLIPAWLASAGAAFELENYADAEQRYAAALNAMQPLPSYSDKERAVAQRWRDKRLQMATDNYASAIYKQAEALQNQGETERAIAEYQRLVSAAPSSQLRVTAQRDAIVLMSANATSALQWQAVTTAIPAFLADFPAHSDRLDMLRRQLQAHSELEQWSRSSAIATQLATELGSQTAPPKQSQSAEAAELRLAAAEFATKSGDKALAIERYRAVIQSRSVSNDPAINEPLYEAYQQLALLLDGVGDSRAALANYRSISALQPDSAARSPRAQFITANASAQLANQDFENYRKLRLVEPLAASLANKQQALEAAIAAYDRTERYAIERFALLATARKAEIYADFAKAMMDSARPQGLDELALEEYEILLEEQAYPFEEQAIELYEINVKRAWQGMRSGAIDDSYRALKDLMPARYAREEILE